MKRYFIEWQSGLTELIDVTETNRAKRGNHWEQWPTDWPLAILSAAQVADFTPGHIRFISNQNFASQQMNWVQNPSAQNFNQLSFMDGQTGFNRGL